MKKQYSEFLDLLFQLKKEKKNFKVSGNEIETYINALSKEDFIEIVKEIGTIPEIIEASSTEEKLYSKASDIILARCFSEIGLKAKAVSERGNSADIIAESEHGYT
ncbi:MAG: HindIII family type II restriction endonuclease, partial [Clostridium sp.]|nr:HindIII family type II restriction endonuclease [Clostridium sp.]